MGRVVKPSEEVRSGCGEWLGSGYLGFAEF